MRETNTQEKTSEKRADGDGATPNPRMKKAVRTTIVERTAFEVQRRELRD